MVVRANGADNVDTLDLTGFTYRFKSFSEVDNGDNPTTKSGVIVIEDLRFGETELTFSNIENITGGTLVGSTLTGTANDDTLSGFVTNDDNHRACLK